MTVLSHTEKKKTNIKLFFLSRRKTIKAKNLAILHQLREMLSSEALAF